MFNQLRIFACFALCLLGSVSPACTPIRPVVKSESAAGASAHIQTGMTEPQISEPCAGPGERKCTGPDGARLECQGGAWVSLPACSGQERCADAGECRVMTGSPCAKGAGTEYCEGERKRVCIDAVTSMEVSCGVNRRCRNLGTVECGCIPGAIDMGDGCKLASDCKVGNGGCDAASSCSVENGTRVCGPCPNGYLGDGATGCKPVLVALALSCGSQPLALSTDVYNYRVDVPLLCPQITLRPTLPERASVKLNAMPLTAEGDWTSELLKLGDNPIELTLTSESGIDTTYHINVARSGMQRNYIKASNTEADDKFGYRMALSGDTLVVAAAWEDGGGRGVDPPDDNRLSGSGAVYVFVRQGDKWTQQAYIKSDAPRALEYFGSSVSISGDTLAVGATNIEPLLLTSLNVAHGTVYIYKRVAGTWTFTTRLQASDASANDVFGWKTHFDRDVLLVAAPFASDGAMNSGAVYRFDTSTWKELGKIKVKTPRANTGLGTNMTIDGDTLVVGAWADSSDEMWAGSAYVFARTADNWEQTQRLTAPSITEQSVYGDAVAVSGDLLAISEPGTVTTPLATRGIVHLYERVAGNWMQTNRIFAPEPRTYDYYGSPLKLTPSYLVVGCHGDPSGATGLQGDMNNTNQPYSGAVYLYARRGNELALSTFMKPFNTDRDDGFGTQISTGDDLLIASAPYESAAGRGVDPEPNGTATNSGAVYVFQ